MDSFLERFIEDIVKGAGDSFARGSRAPGERLNIEVSRNNHGREEKLANYAGLGAALGGPVGAALGADQGQGLSAAGGSALGGMGGMAAGGIGGAGLGALIAALTGHSPATGASVGTGIGSGIGGYAGSIYGGHKGGHKDSVLDKLSSACDAGVKTAAVRFGIKEAFLPLLGSIAGPALARAGVGALARGGGAMGGIANKVLPRIGGGMGGMAFDAASSMAGGALGNNLQPQGPMG